MGDILATIVVYAIIASIAVQNIVEAITSHRERMAQIDNQRVQP